MRNKILIFRCIKGFYALFFIIGIDFILGCGVKGSPQAPLEPPFLGHGDIALPKKGPVNKRNNKYQYNKDFDEKSHSDKEFE